MPECSDGYFTRVMRGLEGALLNAGYLYFNASHLGREDLIREYQPALMQRGVDGLIFINTPVHEHPGVPSVCVSHPPRVFFPMSLQVRESTGLLPETTLLPTHTTAALPQVSRRKPPTQMPSTLLQDAD